jgi:hypothetical protein
MCARVVGCTPLGRAKHAQLAVASTAEKLTQHRLHLPALDLGREKENDTVPADLGREESGAAMAAANGALAQARH